jgi:hypothetical protein
MFILRCDPFRNIWDKLDIYFKRDKDFVPYQLTL